MPKITAAALEHERQASIEREAELAATRSQALGCHCCGRPFVYKGPRGNDGGRFCSDRCREAYDAGAPAFDPLYGTKSDPRFYNLPFAPGGFRISCGGCGKGFTSKGLRCCPSKRDAERERRPLSQHAPKVDPGRPSKCEADYRRKAENKAVANKLPGELVAPRRKCQAPDCDREIPNWINPGSKQAKHTSKRTRFCSPACQQRAARIARVGHDGSPAEMNGKTAKKSPFHAGSQATRERRWPIADALGGIRAPEDVIAIECFEGRQWTSGVSSDGVAYQVARIKVTEEFLRRQGDAGPIKLGACPPEEKASEPADGEADVIPISTKRDRTTPSTPLSEWSGRDDPNNLDIPEFLRRAQTPPPIERREAA